MANRIVRRYENDENELEKPDPIDSVVNPHEDDENQEEDGEEGEGGVEDEGGGGEREGGEFEEGREGGERGDGNEEIEEEEEEEKPEIDYDKPCCRCCCCYFFRRRPQNDTSDKEMVMTENRHPAYEAKASRMAQLLYFKDDVEAESRKARIQMDLVDLQRPEVPMSFRLYDFAKPASEDYILHCLRQEARIALCSTLESFKE
ncbi:unnamed protein product [Dibothriocephalus latus]|uniref:Uncharacterized protein n=1 Tax=Dibothriocephalus latus TaxID=60516 RepID=A0A3P7NGV8_DIBLA|nr:unnamed protein product [Dibothriocephalus latus]